MLRGNRIAIATLFISTSFIVSCGGANPGAQVTQPRGKHNADKVLNLYTWSDYLAPDTISSFEKLTGIKVSVSYFETNETLEARMLTGNSGFDVVVPTAPFFERQIRGGAYQMLDKKELPNLVNLDPAIMARVALNDPGNRYGVVYAWTTYGIGYNEKMVAEALPNVSVDSWRLIFDPAFAAKLSKCGISTIDAPAGVVRLVLKYLGKNPNAPSPQDLSDVASVLMKIRPYVRNIDSSNYIEAMANGDICIALGYSGDFVQARKRAEEAKNGIKIGFVIPQEGSLISFDMLSIPKDAPHVANAHAFINYLMDPKVIADITNFVGYANANFAATPLIDASILSDTVVYPPRDEQERLFVQMQDPPEQARAITRLWQRFKTGQ